LQLLEKYLPLVEKRNDLYLERITLYNQLGEHRKAKNLLTSYKFHPWEGGEGKVIAQYLICNVELAKQLITEGDYDTALGLLSEAENYPPNLGEEKLVSVQENDIHYWKGFVYEKSGNNEMAHQYYTMATKGISEPTQAIFYNDTQPDKIFYQGLAWRKLKDPSRSHNLFKRLVDYGLSHMEDEISIDYFAVSLPDLLVFNVDLNLRNRIHCFYIMALGNLGLGKEHMLQAEKYFNQILELDKNHQGTLIHKRMIKTENMN
jgi:tetratricopeptide (TPR) repeat protein